MIEMEPSLMADGFLPRAEQNPSFPVSVASFVAASILQIRISIYEDREA